MLQYILVICIFTSLYTAQQFVYSQREKKKNNLWYPFTTYTYKHSPIPETEYNFPAYMYGRMKTSCRADYTLSMQCAPCLLLMC